MQEIDFTIGQGNWLTRQVNIRLSGDARRPYRIVQARRSGLRNFFQGVGIMTRLPIIYHDSLDLGYDGRVAIRQTSSYRPGQPAPAVSRLIL